MLSFSWCCTLVVIMVAFATTTTNLVQATRAPMYIFTDEGIGIGCTDTEWNTVLQVMGNATRDNHRRRLGSGSSSRGSQQQHHHRQLSCPKWCGRYCAAMGVGCGTQGRRRERVLQKDSSSGKGGKPDDCNSTCIDGDVTACAADIAAIDAALFNFTAVSVSNQCQKLLEGDKTISCPDFTTADCYIKGISAWDTKPSNTAPTLLVPKLNATGTNFCAKTELALLVDTNFVVGKVTMSLYFTKSLATTPMKLDKVYEGGAAPYYVFGSKPHKLKDGTLGIQVNNKKMDAVGWYTLTIVAADNPTDVKSVSFTVTKC
jgi:hypothetical protein